MTPAPAPAGNAEQLLLAALAERYGGAEFSARSAAADLSPALWQVAGVPRPDAGSCGRWLRGRKERGAALASRPNRDGVALWKLRGVPTPVARDPAPAEASPAPAVFREPPENPPFPAPRTRWWAVPAPPPAPAPGGAAERDGGASWWASDGGTP
jgi:hypothetical protein